MPKRYLCWGAVGIVLIGMIVIGSLCLGRNDASMIVPSESTPAALSTEIFPTEVLSTEVPQTEIPQTEAFSPQFHCIKPVMPYVPIENLGALWEAPLSDWKVHYYKTQVVYEGQDIRENRAHRDYYGNLIFWFRQGEQEYSLAVSKFAAHAIAAVPLGAEMTIFISHQQGDLGPNETVVEDFAIGKSLAVEPDFHWWAEIVQNGQEYPLQEGEIVLENRPFTVRIYLPRKGEKFPEVRMHSRFAKLGETEEWMGTQLEKACRVGVLETPKNPFCSGSGEALDHYDSGRHFSIGTWTNIPLVFENCAYHTLDSVKIEQAYIVYEKDVLYYILGPEDVMSHVDISEKKPISELSGEKVILALFVDVDNDDVIDENELAIGTLHFEDVHQ